MFSIRLPFLLNLTGRAHHEEGTQKRGERRNAHDEGSSKRSRGEGETERKTTRHDDRGPITSQLTNTEKEMAERGEREMKILAQRALQGEDLRGGKREAIPSPSQ